MRAVIAGGGPVAWRCAFSLRELGFDGPIELVCEEPCPPYDRTMVSKDLLTRSPGDDELALASAADWEAAGVELRLGVPAIGLDTERRRVELADGEAVAYDMLLIATGARPRLPVGMRCHGVHVLRTHADALLLERELVRGSRLAVVGGGLIAGEVATSALDRGVAVTMIEALAAPLARGVGVDVGRRIEAIHRRAGVEVLAGAAVERIGRAPGGFEVVLRGGAAPVEADTVVVAVGAEPVTDWLAGAAGIELDDGVVTDARCRTGAPGVFAAGDCARWPSARLRRRVRTEHWDTAVRHGAAAAGSMLGSDRPFDPIGFAWSIQHGIRLQWIGETADADRVAVEELESGLVARYWRAGALSGGFAVNAPRQVAQMRRELMGELVPSA
jgi:3-phenylpropionate/trans-cinnamate dioxygenase ferredoxin reductase component